MGEEKRTVEQTAGDREKLRADIQKQAHSRLCREWGRSAAVRLDDARLYRDQLALSDDDMQATEERFGPEGTLRHAAETGAGLRELGKVTPEEAAAELARLRHDREFGRRLVGGHGRQPDPAALRRVRALAALAAKAAPPPPDFPDAA